MQATLSRRIYQYAESKIIQLRYSKTFTGEISNILWNIHI